MEKEEGLIEEIIGGKALVRIEKSAHCATCESRDSCHVADDRGMVIEVANELRARAGDRVEVAIPTRSLLKLSILVYLLPVLGLMAGAYAGEAWAPRLGTSATFASVALGLLVMGTVFTVLKIIDRRVRRSGEYSPRMRRILSSAAPPLQPDDSI